MNREFARIIVNTYSPQEIHKLQLAALPMNNPRPPSAKHKDK